MISDDLSVPVDGLTSDDVLVLVAASECGARAGKRVSTARVLAHALKLGRCPPLEQILVAPDASATPEQSRALALLGSIQRLLLPWRARCPAFMGDGHFGSRDGSPPADPAYSAVGLTPYGEQLIHSQLGEPLPNLLLNGWYTPDLMVPPHAPDDVFRALNALVEGDIDAAHLRDSIQGPDLPCGSGWISDQAVDSLYATGEGAVTFTGRLAVNASDTSGEHVQLVVTALPLGVSLKQWNAGLGRAFAARVFAAVESIDDYSDATIQIALRTTTGALGTVTRELLTHMPFMVTHRAVLDRNGGGLVEVLGRWMCRQRNLRGLGLDDRSQDQAILTRAEQLLSCVHAARMTQVSRT